VRRDAIDELPDEIIVSWFLVYERENHAVDVFFCGLLENVQSNFLTEPKKIRCAEFKHGFEQINRQVIMKEFVPGFLGYSLSDGIFSCRWRAI
jgi:hypothetical protein